MRAPVPPVRTSASPTPPSTPSSSARRTTPLYRLKPPSQRVGEVLGALAEGVDVAAARIFGHAEGTITRWLTRAGRHAGALPERAFRELDLPHVQRDELRAGLRGQRRVVWLWVALHRCSWTSCAPACAASAGWCGCGWRCTA